jgi:hypothetical protein
MGAGYGGANCVYQESADFPSNGGLFLIRMLDSSSLGIGFDTADFKILLNGIVVDSESFATLALAQTFFSTHTFGTSLTGPTDVEIAFDETLSSGEGFGFDFTAAMTSTTPLPSTLPLFAGGLGFMGYLTRRRKKKARPTRLSPAENLTSDFDTPASGGFASGIWHWTTRGQTPNYSCVLYN